MRALEDLNAVAERARREPDPVEEVRQRIDTLLVEAAALIANVQRLEALTAEVVLGEHELIAVGERVDRGAAEVAAGAAELTAVAQSIDETLGVFRAALPKLLRGLETAEQLEESVETVADAVEPLQGAAERVGRVTRRLSSDKRR